MTDTEAQPRPTPDGTPSATSARSPTADLPHAALLFLTLSALYLWTAPRTVVLEDDGLFILAGHFLGIEHPPGYPVFVLLAKLATLWPFGSVAWRVHALNGLIAAGTCVLVLLSVRLLVPGRLAAWFGALGLGVSATFWSQALIADVYPLNALVFFALLYVALRLAPPGEVRAGDVPAAPLYAFALLAGLGTANHWPLLALSAPGLVIILWPRWRAVARYLPGMMAAFAAGLLPYAWMVWRSHMHPEVSFQGPIDSWPELVQYILRSGYAEVDNSPSSGIADKLGFGAYLIRQAGMQLLPPFALLGLAGAIFQWRVWGTRTAAGLMAAFLGPTLLLVLLLDFDFQPLQREAFRVYPVAAWGIMAIWAALGLHLAGEWTARYAGPRALGAVAGVVLTAGALANWHANDRSRDWLGRAYGEVLLQGAAPGSLLLVGGDVAIPTTGYLHLSEKMRPDLLLVGEDALVLEPKPFDPFRTQPDARAGLVDAFAESRSRPVFRMHNDDGRSGSQSWLLFHPDPDGGKGEVRFHLPAYERSLLLRLAGTGPMADGWSELLRRALLADFASFATRAQAAGDWPSADAELAAVLERVLELPEAALARAEVLVEVDPAASRAELDRLLAHFARRVANPWIGKRPQARYFNVIARLAQRDGNVAALEQALLASLHKWPGEENPAAAVLAQLRERRGER